MPTGAPAPRLSPPPPDERVPTLDGVRGLAIVLVLVNNVYPGTQALSGTDAFAWHVANLGWVGVDLFFVLSGFLITGILLDTKDGAHYFRNFYARRVVRIFPLYYGVLFCVYFIFPHLVHQRAATYAALDRQRWFEWLYVGNFGYALRGYPPFPTVHFWSLAMEEQFYFVWPLVVLLLDRRRLLALCALLLGASFALRLAWVLHGGTTSWLFILTPFRLDGLPTGAIIALTLREPGGRARLARWAKPVLLACAPVALALMVWNEVARAQRPYEIVGVVGFPLIALAFGALLVYTLDAVPGSRTHRVFASPAMRFFGRYSYAMYVFHEFVLWALLRAVPSAAEPPRILGSRIPLSLAVLVVVCAITTALALASWHLYEKRFLSLKRYFPYARAVRQDAGVVSPPPGASPISTLPGSTTHREYTPSA